MPSGFCNYVVSLIPLKLCTYMGLFRFSLKFGEIGTRGQVSHILFYVHFAVYNSLMIKEFPFLLLLCAQGFSLKRSRINNIKLTHKT